MVGSVLSVGSIFHAVGGVGGFGWCVSLFLLGLVVTFSIDGGVGSCDCLFLIFLIVVIEAVVAVCIVLLVGNLSADIVCCYIHGNEVCGHPL